MDSQAQAIVTMQPKRSLWARVLLMLLFGLVYQLCGTLLFFLVVIQLVLTIVFGQPNGRLQQFSRSLGRYLQQLVNFLSFAEETLPFPFSDWPPAE